MLCELPRLPGPTHSVWDVLACAVKLFAPGSRMAMLGFAGGGLLDLDDRGGEALGGDFVAEELFTGKPALLVSPPANG